jgi:hypothetical protein
MIYPKAVWDPGPFAKQGYTAYPSPQPKEGFVLHSMEGSFSAARGRLFTAYDPEDPYTWASWHFSVLKDGAVVQHYDTGAVCWHCGVPGDPLPWTAAVGNVALIGIEHEGRAGEPFTDAQAAASLELQRWCYSVVPGLKAPALRSSHWEHRWLSGTACPSGRVPWLYILDGLLEDDMALTEKEAARLMEVIEALDKRVDTLYRILTDDYDAGGPQKEPRWLYWQTLMQQAAASGVSPAALLDELKKRL